MIATSIFLLLLLTPFLTTGSFGSEAKDVDEYSTSSATDSALASSSPLHDGLIFDPSNSHAFIRNRRMDSQNITGGQTSVETDVDLDVLYRIPEPEIFYCETSASFVIRYRISDWITDDMCQYRMYRKDDNGDLTIDITDNQFLAPELLFDETPRGNGIGDRTVVYNVRADSSLILSSPVYYGTQPDDPLHKLPYITFSTQFELWNSDVGGLVNWFEIEFYFYLQLSNLQFTEHLRKLELEKLAFLPFPTPLNDAPVESAGSDADEIVGTDDSRAALEPTRASEDKESSSLPSVASDTGISKLLRKSSKTKEGVKQPYYGTDDMISYPEHMHHNDHRQLLRCFDGFEILLFVDDLTQAPSVSSAPTISPAPTAPTASLSPSTAPTDKGIIINPPQNVNFTGGEAGDDAFGVFGYLCDENLDPIAKTENPFGNGEHYAIHEQGTQVRVCVERNSKCVKSQIYLRSIDAFSFFKASDASIRQVAIEPIAIPANNGLTEVTCSRGSHKCYFDTLLLADFYLESGIMYGNGKATLQFGSSSTSSRWLHNVGNDDDDQRQLQDDREGGVEDAIGTISFKFAFLKPEDMEELVNIQQGPVFAEESEGSVDADENPVLAYMIALFLVALVLLCCITIKVRNCRNAKCRHGKQEKEGQEKKTVSIIVRRHRRRKATVSLTDDSDGSCRSRSPSRMPSAISDDTELCSPNSTRSTRSASRSSRSRPSNRSSSRRGRTTVFLTDDGGGRCRSRSRSRRSSAMSGDDELCSPNSTRSTRSRRSDRSRSSSRRRRSIALSVPPGDDEFDCRNSPRSARNSNRSSRSRSRSRRSIRSCRSSSIRECNTQRWLDDDGGNEDAIVEKTSERSGRGNHYKSYSRRAHRSFDGDTKDEARTHHTRTLSTSSNKTRSNRWLFDDNDEERDDDVFVDETLEVEEGRRSKRKSRSQF